MSTSALRARFRRRATRAVPAIPATRPTEMVDGEETTEVVAQQEQQPVEHAKIKQVKEARQEIRAARMLAIFCERSFLEHQLAASHLMFYSFCEQMHPPVLSVSAVFLCDSRLPTYRAPDCAPERAIAPLRTQGCSLSR